MSLNILLMAAVFTGNYILQTAGGTTTKGLCSLGFVLMGIINLIYALFFQRLGFKYSIFLCVGLIFAMLGDIIIDFDFVIGAALFALGHIFYFIAQHFVFKIKANDFIAIALIFLSTAAFLLFCPFISFYTPSLKWVCIIYTLIISLMVGKAISNLIRKPCALTIILAVGSVLFFVSDFMLALDAFVGLFNWTAKTCLATYYPAECLLALSSLYVINEK